MSDLRDLYQEIILDHNRRPRNFGPLAAANYQLAARVLNEEPPAGTTASR